MKNPEPLSWNFSVPKDSLTLEETQNLSEE